MSDLDEFLRRAAERRAKAKRSEIEIIEPVEAELVEAELVEAEPVSLSSHVTSHLDNREFTDRASHLGERVGQADDVLEARLHATFEHTLGSLGVGRRPQEAAPVVQHTPTSPWLQLLGSPESVRQAIVLSEILQPPRHRW